MTKRDAAARAGIIPTNLNSMITAPSWPTLERLAAALGVSVSELIRDPANDDSSSPAPAPGGAVCPRCGCPLMICAAADDSSSPAPASVEEEPPQQ